ncbi:MAG: acyltransferase, partial [Ferruginibacter sp.]
MKKFIIKTFGLRKEMGIGFYVADFFFRKILRQNADTSWAIHYTSKIHCPQNIKCGKNVFPGDSPNNYIEANNGIFIGDYTNIGPGVGLISSNHNLIDNDKHTYNKPIKIGKHCWIGMNAVILPGVELADFTIVGAGAIVTKSFTEGCCVIAGNPASLIKQL